ncbi:sporulation membrane protein YtaF [Rubeoparvulum massiliense]|uniref:sporulation membrane protein YtaF n=1 Tax=Rubeoparvulum massiliense TaxID=1631346 RepID=UPI00065E6642|nr:sporulation membrane protein YtaF [Rubeoparvulum massiliense]
MQAVSLIFLAIAVSMDGLGVGFTYGLRKIKLSWWSIILIMMLSCTMLFISMLLGHWISDWLSDQLAQWIGASILILLGVWALFQLDQQHGTKKEPLTPSLTTDGSPTTLTRIELKRLGIVIQILREPTLADVDDSGTISFSETLLLGLALSLDAFGAGLGAALLNYPMFTTALAIAVVSGCCLWLGIWLGNLFSYLRWLTRLSLLPGLLLIVLGIFRLLS